jgi:hypothetical protein
MAASRFRRTNRNRFSFTGNYAAGAGEARQHFEHGAIMERGELEETLK